MKSTGCVGTVANINVVWTTHNQASISRGYWDGGWLERILDSTLHPHSYTFTHYPKAYEVPKYQGAVVVIPGRWNLEYVGELAVEMSEFTWALVVVTGDEESLFNWEGLHNQLSVDHFFWIQTPRPDKHTHELIRPIGDFWPPSCPEMIRKHFPTHSRTWNWTFSGQINNQSRLECYSALRAREHNHHDGFVKKTDGFGAGLEYRDYIYSLCNTKVAPCPSGTFTPDTFRLYEALEAGCIPITDIGSPTYGDIGYWQFLFGEEPPFPLIRSWKEFNGRCDELLGNWADKSRDVSDWWSGYKRRIAREFLSDIQYLSGERYSG